MGVKLTFEQLQESKTQTHWKEVIHFYNDLQKDFVSSGLVTDEFTSFDEYYLDVFLKNAPLQVVSDADLEVPSLLLFWEQANTWVLMIDKKCTDFSYAANSDTKYNHIRQLLFHELYHLLCRQNPIHLTFDIFNNENISCLTSVEINENHELNAELFSLLCLFSLPEQFISKLKAIDSTSSLNLVQYSSCFHNADYEDLCKYITLCLPQKYHCLKYIMGNKDYDGKYIPNTYSKEARESLENINTMRMEPTAIRQVIEGYFQDSKILDFIQETILGNEKFRCRACYNLIRAADCPDYIMCLGYKL